MNTQQLLATLAARDVRLVDRLIQRLGPAKIRAIVGQLQTPEKKREPRQPQRGPKYDDLRAMAVPGAQICYLADQEIDTAWKLSKKVAGRTGQRPESVWYDLIGFEMLDVRPTPRGRFFTADNYRQIGQWLDSVEQYPTGRGGVVGLIEKRDASQVRPTWERGQPSWLLLNVPLNDKSRGDHANTAAFAAKVRDVLERARGEK